MIAPRSLAPVEEAVFDIAVEHIAWCIRQGQTLYEIFECLRVPVPANATWNDAIWAVAAAYDLAGEIRSRLKVRAA